MIDKLILHPRTREQVVQFIAQPTHAVLLVGSNGIGKTTLAKEMAGAALQLDGVPEQHPYFMLVAPEKDSISIDAIRELQRFLQLKTIGEQPLRRAVIVEHAEALTTEAQNAYLKLLEEPPADTVMILTADNQRALLPTILSRLQQVTMYAPAEDELKAHFGAANGQVAVNQAYFLSGGLPGLMHALLDGDTAHPLTAGVAQAKEALQKPVFERLAMVEGICKQKDDARYVVRALQHIARTMLTQAAAKDDEAKLRQWHKVLRVATDADQALGQNANTKLVLSNMMLHL